MNTHIYTNSFTRYDYVMLHITLTVSITDIKKRCMWSAEPGPKDCQPAFQTQQKVAPYHLSHCRLVGVFSESGALIWPYVVDWAQSVN